MLAAAIASWQLLRRAPGRVPPPDGADLADAMRIIRAQDRGAATMALMGDKSFLFSASRTAFLMYARRGRSWVALHDPVGPRAEWAELIWRFVELADAHDGRVVFYQIRPDSLPLYLDAGLKLLKVGEEAIVPLDPFGLEGGRRSNLRYAIKRGERDGLDFEMVQDRTATAFAPILKAISAEWLAGQRRREKGFSVATLAPAYLATQAVALVRQNGRPVAFATIMTTERLGEAAVGVMRHTPGASAHAMEFLFTRMALHLKQAGFQTLSLGMAPLAGLSPTPLASFWHHIGSLLWQHGGRFYNFQGLRTFKNKFTPRWEPRYLAASGTVGPFVALADIAVLTGRGRA
jgi:phosphatidylglycerol lysyltransferase